MRAVKIVKKQVSKIGRREDREMGRKIGKKEDRKEGRIISHFII